MIVVGMVFVAGGVGMLWLGKHLIRGLRFLFALAFDRAKRIAQTIRQKMGRESLPTPKPSFG